METRAKSREDQNPLKRKASHVFDGIIIPSPSIATKRPHLEEHSSKPTNDPQLAEQSTGSVVAAALQQQSESANIGPSESGVSHGMQNKPVAPYKSVFRSCKPLPPITEKSSCDEWSTVDTALETHVAPMRVCPEYALSPEQCVRDDVAIAAWAHVPSTAAVLTRASKGKGRMPSGWTETRWSHVGEFKSRLDGWYGRGDINRGLGSRPKANAVSVRLHAPPPLVAGEISAER